MAFISTITGFIEWDTLIRLIVALILSAIVGFEREKTGHPAGLRTHIMVCVTAALLMATAQTLFIGDAIARFGAAIVTGVGFLGAGAIIVYGKEVHGLTTAASVWAIAGIGTVIGLGMYFEAVVASIIMWAVLRFKPIGVKARKR
ncbi:MgtC/SapB family protein [Thermoproteota archaeon]